jgi:hypothetical protein
MPEARLRALIQQDALRFEVLKTVRSLNLPDCWVAAGFVRNAVWDHLHGQAHSPIASDVDVIWFDPAHCDPVLDRHLEALLQDRLPGIDWSVKNQARMHLRNADPPYASATDAMRFWPETATAVAVRLNQTGHCEVAAPLGLDDLFGLVLRPTPRFAEGKRALYHERLRAKAWHLGWPLLRCESR